MTSYLYNALEGEFNIASTAGGGGGGGGNKETWIPVVDSDPVDMIENGFYFVLPGVGANLNLPLTAKTGSRNRVASAAGASFSINANDGQNIIYNSLVGVDSGNASALNGTAVELLVIVEDTTWLAISGTNNVLVENSPSNYTGTNPAGIVGSGLVQYNATTGQYNYTGGLNLGDMVVYRADVEAWVRLAAIANQTWNVADDSNDFGWRASTIQETVEGEFLSGLGRDNGFGVITNAAYSPLANPATGLTFPNLNQAGLSANGALGFLARQFGVDSNLLHNFYSGMTWNYTAPGAYPYSVSGGNLVINVDTSAGPETILLPDSTDFGRIFAIVDTAGDSDENPFTITSVSGSVLIGGQTSQVCNTSWGGYIIQWDGTQYNLLSKPQEENNLSGYVVTTDDTPTVLLSIPMSINPATYIFEFKVCSFDVTNSLGNYNILTAGFRTTGSTPVVLTNQNNLQGDDPSEPPGYVLRYVAQGFSDRVDVIVTGIAATEIHWKCQGSYQLVN